MKSIFPLLFLVLIFLQYSSANACVNDRRAWMMKRARLQKRLSMTREEWKQFLLHEKREKWKQRQRIIEIQRREAREQRRLRRRTYLQKTMPLRLLHNSARGVLLKMISGDFPRYSMAMHRWRIRNSQKQLKRKPDKLRYYDDLAASYDKLGQPEKAASIIASKMKKEKTPSYESLANYGTFLIHSRRLKEGLTYLNKSIQKNPDAHFGREIYQILLVEYVIQKRQQSAKLRWISRGKFSGGFLDYLWNEHNKGREFPVGQHFPRIQKGHSRKPLLSAAIRGILGMMYFGNYRSPWLLSALGSLLSKDYGPRGRYIASMAYLKASQEAKHKARAAFYKSQATLLLQESLVLEHKYQPGFTLYVVTQLLKDEVKVADRKFLLSKRNQQNVIHRSKKPDETLFEKWFSKNPTAVAKALLLPTKTFATLLNKELKISYTWGEFTGVKKYSVASFFPPSTRIPLDTDEFASMTWTHVLFHMVFTTFAFGFLAALFLGILGLLEWRQRKVMERKFFEELKVNSGLPAQA